MSEAVIRRADIADADILSALGGETFAATFSRLYPPDDLAAFLAESHSADAWGVVLGDERAATWLMEFDSEAIGYALVGPCGLPHPEASPAHGELTRIYLLSEWQGGGRGGRLMKTAIDWLAEAYPGPLWIGVWSQNYGAQRLYERVGFRKVGEYEFPVGATRDHEFIFRRG